MATSDALTEALVKSKVKPSDHSFVAASGERFTSLMDFLIQGDYLGPISQRTEDEVRNAVQRYTDAVCERQADTDVNDEESELFEAVKLLDHGLALSASLVVPAARWDEEVGPLLNDVRKFLQEPHVKLLRSKLKAGQPAGAMARYGKRYDSMRDAVSARCHCGAYVVGAPGTKGHGRDKCPNR